MLTEQSDSDSDSGDQFNDPFSRMNSTHPAIQESHAVSSDIFLNLFDDIFEAQVFDRWFNHKHSWQLHCIGGPGSGKTTFALLTAAKVRQLQRKANTHAVHIACVFIEDGLFDSDLTFLEDLLHSIYRQLTRAALPTSHATARLYEKYAHACDEGRRVSIRTDLLRRGLQQRLVEIRLNETAFLVLDNIDQCNPSLRELLERELAQLQQNGLRILITSRILRNGRRPRLYCDFHTGWMQFDAFWHCGTCNKVDICVECFEQSLKCQNCETNTLWEEPEYMEISLDFLSEASICNYIAWDLEKEHGDLGLESSFARKPPLSHFGVAFVKNNYGHDWVQEIAALVQNNVVTTKLALDRIHHLSHPEEFEFNPKRLPNNLQAIFKSAVSSIAQDSNTQKSMALKAMVAVANYGTVAGPGVPLSTLAMLLRERSAKLASPRSFEDIIDASRGFLRLAAPYFGVEEYSIVAYNPLWHLYIWDDYNDDIWMANTLLPVSKLPRHSTMAHSHREPFEEFLERQAGQPSPDLASVSSAISPPLNRGPFTFSRSRTYMTPVAPDVIAPTLGLGLKFGSKLPVHTEDS